MGAGEGKSIDQGQAWTECGLPRPSAARSVFAMTRRSTAFPPCSIVDPRNPGSPTGFSSSGTVTLAQSVAAAPSTPVVAAICAAEILGLVGFSIVPALPPQFIEARSL